MNKKNTIQNNLIELNSHFKNIFKDVVNKLVKTKKDCVQIDVDRLNLKRSIGLRGICTTYLCESINWRFNIKRILQGFSLKFIR